MCEHDHRAPGRLLAMMEHVETLPRIGPIAQVTLNDSAHVGGSDTSGANSARVAIICSGVNWSPSARRLAITDCVIC
jgi:hypothetical protein